jgi:D-tagatose-1,6-bisphosphate aldolase subunit GatZ/KbaZ
MSVLLDVIAAHKQGRPVGLYSVCSANEYVLRAAMATAARYRSPLLIEATSNQVDQFGGYTGMTPRQFHSYVHQVAAGQGFDPSQLILGGDHLGPNAWQRLPAAEAMARARDLIAAYVDAGFEKIHLDCSMRCADDPPQLDDALIAARAAELCEVAEASAQRLGGAAHVCYVIGTEVPAPGGETALDGGLAVTRVQAAEATLAVHAAAFSRRGLNDAWNRVIALVVQPGVDFDHSHVHHYQPDAAQALAQFIAGRERLVYEAHSTDYQTETAFHQLVRDHFAILKVGPALTYALREAWFALSAIERELLPVERQAYLPQVLDRRMAELPGHWQKYYSGNPTDQQLLRKYSLSDRSRYYWNDAEVRQAQSKLLDNLEQSGIPLTVLSQFMPELHPLVEQGRMAARPQTLLENKVSQVLARYARACCQNMYERMYDRNSAALA